MLINIPRSIDQYYGDGAAAATRAAGTVSKNNCDQWRLRKSCKKRDLLALIGQLQHMSSGSSSQRMIDLSMTARELYHLIHLNRGFCSDLEWWSMFLSNWNGVSLLSTVVHKPPDVTITPDASGNWRGGAFSSTGEWFQCSWPEEWKDVHITVKELVPVVITATLWGFYCRGKTIQCRTDNSSSGHYQFGPQQAQRSGNALDEDFVFL